MVTKNKTGREIILDLGRSMFGEYFNIDNPDVFATYQHIYEYLLARAKNKRKKGLLIIGGLGVGKSAMMKVMQRVFKDTESRFRWVNSYDLKDLAEVYTVSQIKEMYGYDLKMDLYIDDIGIAADVKRYGNTVNIITEILMERYDLFVSSGYKTHISSNMLTSVQDEKAVTLKTIYGARILDRIKEMTDVVKFKGESQRR